MQAARSQPPGAPAREVGDLTHTHLPLLDGLRGLAILLVVLYHFCLPHERFHGREGGWLLQLGQAGWLGVDLFFVLSGFLITSILVQTRSQPHYFRNFLGRRFLRIWPLYYASLVALLVVLPAVLPQLPAALQSMRDKQVWFWLYGANWLFALEGGFNHTSGGFFWSLAVEEQFYLVWPLVVFWLDERRLLRVSLALLALSLVLRVVLGHLGVSTGALYTMTFTHLDGLAVGSALAVCARSPMAMQRVRRALPWLALVCAAGLAAVRVADGNAFFWSRHMALYGYTLAAVLFGTLLAAVLGGAPLLGLSRLFGTAAMRHFGKYSYALYVVHVPIAGVVFPRLMQALRPASGTPGYEAAFAACVGVSFLLSWAAALLSWHLFEKHILGFKRYFSYEGGGGAAPAVPPGLHSGARRPGR